MKNYLKETPLLNFTDPVIQSLFDKKKWKGLDEKNRILSIYNYVRDDIAFGYNEEDGIPASRVLEDGYGQCNTKGVLFMALLRGAGIPCRIHGFTIDKKLQKGALKGLYYLLSPREILHSWVEVYFENRWMNLEGFILDVPYLTKLQKRFRNCRGSFCGYGVATDNFQNPAIYWDQNDTYIQKEGIVRDLGIFDSADSFFAEHRQKLGQIAELMYRNLIRHLMNRNIRKIRNEVL